VEDLKINVYNEKFAIPEMIKTFRSLCIRLQRDLFFVALILIYIFIVKKIPIAGLNKELNYEGLNIIYVLAIFNVIYFFIVLHFFKIFILYRQIDDEVKMFYAGANRDLYSRIDSSSAMTAFVLSENITADLILAGHKRHPTLKRLIWLQLVILCVAIFLTYKMINDYGNIGSPLLWFLIIIVIYLIILYPAVKLFFINRSAFLHKASLVKKAFIAYYNFLSAFKNIDEKGLSKGFEELQNKAVKKLEHFNKLDLSNITDFYDENKQFLEDNMKDIKEDWDRLPEDDIKQIVYGKASEDASSGIKNLLAEIKQPMDIFATLKDLEPLKNTSVYALGFLYHVRNYFGTIPNELYKFLWYALTS
jgi:hypothetical protein